jgi:hypothetical protein
MYFQPAASPAPRVSSAGRPSTLRKPAAELDEGVTQSFLTQVPSHVSIEDLLVEANQAIEIGGDRGEVMRSRGQRMAGAYV